MLTMQSQQTIYRLESATCCSDGHPIMGKLVTAREFDSYGDVDLDSSGEVWQATFDEKGFPSMAALPGIPEVAPEAFDAIYQWFLA